MSLRVSTLLSFFSYGSDGMWRRRPRKASLIDSIRFRSRMLAAWRWWPSPWRFDLKLLRFRFASSMLWRLEFELKWFASSSMLKMSTLLLSSSELVLLAIDELVQDSLKLLNEKQNINRNIPKQNHQNIFLSAYYLKVMEPYTVKSSKMKKYLTVEFLCI